LSIGLEEESVLRRSEGAIEKKQQPQNALRGRDSKTRNMGPDSQKRKGGGKSADQGRGRIIHGDPQGKGGGSDFVALIRSGGRGEQKGEMRDRKIVLQSKKSRLQALWSETESFSNLTPGIFPEKTIRLVSGGGWNSSSASVGT